MIVQSPPRTTGRWPRIEHAAQFVREQVREFHERAWIQESGLGVAAVVVGERRHTDGVAYPEAVVEAGFAQRLRQLFDTCRAQPENGGRFDDGDRRGHEEPGGVRRAYRSQRGWAAASA